MKERGIFDSAAIVFSADHRESLGEHDYYFEHGWFAYEPGLRIPLLVKQPGQREGARIDSLVSNLDLFPTLMSLAGLDADPALEGRSLSESVKSAPVVVESADLYDDKYIGIRVAGEKSLRRESDGREELYDLLGEPRGDRRSFATPSGARA